MKKNIVFGIITVVISIIVTIGVYSTEFNVPNNERALIDSVKKYIHAFDEGKQFEPHFVMKTTVGSQMIVVFDDDKYDHFMGTVIFQRGLTGLYRPIQAKYGAGPVISQVTTSQNLGEAEAVYTAYYAVDCPPEIKSFQITGAIYSEEENRYIPDSTITYDVSKPTFIELCRVQGFGYLNLFDENGVELSPELYLATNEECPHPSIGSAELDIINIVCGFFLVLGAIIAAVFFRGNQRSELIPCEKAIEPSEWQKPIGS